MIRQLRLDERLIHGQVAAAWSKFLDIDTIVVASDVASKDDSVKKILLMGAPVGKKVAIRSIDDTIRLLSDQRANKMKVLIISDNPKDSIKLVVSLNITEVNVANYKAKKADNKIKILASKIEATKEDFDDFVELSKLVDNIYSQALPTSIPISFKTLLKNAK